MEKLRSWQFIAAVVFLLAAVSMRIRDDGAAWMWADTPVVGVVLAVASLAFWVLLAREALRGLQPEQPGVGA